MIRRLAAALVVSGLVVALTSVVALSNTATAHDVNGFSANLTSYQETPASLSTAGHGTFRAHLAGDTLSYELSYSGLEGGTTLAAHIHLGQRATGGGVIAFLCGGGGKPACPSSGTVTGTVTAANVIGPASQGIAAGEFAELIRAMRHGATYANVHTTNFASGEIRGQIRVIGDNS